MDDTKKEANLNSSFSNKNENEMKRDFNYCKNKSLNISSINGSSLELYNGEEIDTEADVLVSLLHPDSIKQRIKDDFNDKNLELQSNNESMTIPDHNNSVVNPKSSVYAFNYNKFFLDKYHQDCQVNQIKDCDDDEILSLKKENKFDNLKRQLNLD